MSNAEIAALIKNAGLSKRKSAILSSMRPAIRIATKRESERKMPLGSSKFGGSADLPQDAYWPSYDGKDMTFVCQLNMRDFGKFDKAKLLPEKGILYFFFDSMQEVTGIYNERGGWNVLFFGGNADELARSKPKRMRTKYRTRACAIECVSIMTPPALDSLAVQDMRLSDDEIEKYAALYDAIENAYPKGPYHHLLGNPHPVQHGRLELDCAIGSYINQTGKAIGDGKIAPYGYHTTKKLERKLRSKARAWRLILQVDSDPEANMMWGDHGMLYFFAREDDMRARNFDDSWAIFQYS